LENTKTVTTNQKQAVENYKSKVSYIDKENIKTFLENLTYPIYHLDFETYQQAIPQYKGIKPFEQIPFQYSLHIEHEDGRLEHKEYLSEDSVDSRYELAQKLCEDIPSDVTVLTYNMSFEKGVIKRLVNLFPNLSPHLLAINENMQDLMTPFQKKWYVTPSMQGSYSIKYVLPALVPEFEKAYKELDSVQNGSQAMNAFANLSKLKEEEKQKMRTSLLEYCKLDTLAMVKILNKLKKI
jgi:DNA-directed RNA polymerase subunit F